MSMGGKSKKKMSEYGWTISQQREMQLLEQVNKDQETITRLQKTVDVADVIQNSVQEQIKLKVGKCRVLGSRVLDCVSLPMCFSSFLLISLCFACVSPLSLPFSSAMVAKHNECSPLARNPKNDQDM